MLLWSEPSKDPASRAELCASETLINPSLQRLGFPGGSDGKESASSVEYLSSIPGLGRSLGEGNGYSLQVFLPGKSHGQKSLAATVHGVPDELDMT